MSANQEENAYTKKVVAKLAGGTLVAATMAAIGPVGTLIVSAAATAYIASQVLKDSEGGKESDETPEKSE